MPKSCVAVGCTNHNMMQPLTVSFHLFPSDPERFSMWVKAVNRINADGSPWFPSKYACICSAHFVTGKPNKDKNHPDYVPSIFTKGRGNGKKISAETLHFQIPENSSKRKKRKKRPSTDWLVDQSSTFRKNRFKAERYVMMDEISLPSLIQENSSVVPMELYENQHTFSTIKSQSAGPRSVDGVQIKMEPVFEGEYSELYESTKENFSHEQADNFPLKTDIKIEPGLEDIHDETQSNEGSRWLCKRMKIEPGLEESQFHLLEPYQICVSDGGQDEGTFDKVLVKVDPDFESNKSSLDTNVEIPGEDRVGHLHIQDGIKSENGLDMSGGHIQSMEKEMGDWKDLSENILSFGEENSSDIQSTFLLEHDYCRKIQPDIKSENVCLRVEDNDMFLRGHTGHLSAERTFTKDDESDNLEKSYQTCGLSVTSNSRKCRSTSFGAHKVTVDMDSVTTTEAESTKENFLDNDEMHLRFPRTVKALEQSNVSYDSESQTFKCLKCGSTFGDKGSIEVHLILDKTDCLGRVSSHGSIDSHIVQHKATNYQCSKCMETFWEESVALVHMMSHNYKCIICDIIFSSFYSLQTHMVNHIGKLGLGCCICWSIFETERSLKEHMVTHLNVSTSLKQRDVSRQTLKKNFRCLFCDEEFDRYSTLNSHMVEHIGRPSFGCCVCKNKFSSQQCLDLHMDTHKTSKIPKLAKSSQTFECCVCKVRFAHIRSLKVHMTLKHTLIGDTATIGKNMCFSCGQDFGSIEKLNGHVAQRYGKSHFVGYTCDVCKQTYASELGLTIHTCRNVNNNLKVFPTFMCKVCKKTFFSVSSLNSHMAAHTSSRTSVVCGERFESVKTLSSLTVEHSGELSFDCDVCKIKYDSRVALAAHMKIHNLECDICKQQFRKIRNLNHHMSVHASTVGKTT